MCGSSQSPIGSGPDMDRDFLTRYGDTKYLSQSPIGSGPDMDLPPRGKPQRGKSLRMSQSPIGSGPDMDHVHGEAYAA